MRRLLLVVAFAWPAVLLACGGASAPAPSPTPTEPAAPTATPAPGGVQVVACGDILAPVDKQHRLDADCEPGDLVALPARFLAADGQQLRAEAAAAMVELLEAALADGHELFVLSAYRSYELQRQVFQWHVDTYGREEAERVSARPGHSEHQLGTAADVTSRSVGLELVKAFGDTPEGRWVAENAHRFGFIVSYPEGQEAVTGYDYEPWHLRYVGKSVAREVVASGLTLHEFLLQRVRAAGG